MRKRSTSGQSLFGLVRRPRGAGNIASFLALLLLSCSGKSESAGNGGAGQSGADGAGSLGSSGGSTTTSLGGNEAMGGIAGRPSGGASAGPSSDAGAGPSGGAGAGPSGGAGGSPNGGIISGAGRAGALGRAGSNPGGSVTDTSLGLACTSDAQCGPSMVCATANGTLFGTGGPSNGMCTKSCSPGGSECNTLKAGATCFNFGTDAAPKRYCLDACVHGDPVELQSKCSGRPDFVCAELGQGTIKTFCLPHCRSDVECGSGLYCDKTSQLGLCSQTELPAGDPVGTPCTPGATTTTCEGFCMRTSAAGATPATGACVELCSAGFECIHSSGSSATPSGLCGGSLSDSFGAFDLGYCLANCSCTADCKLPGDLCRKWPNMNADLASALGAPGVCYPTVAQSIELSCGNAGTGGAGAGTPPTAGTSGNGL